MASSSHGTSTLEDLPIQEDLAILRRRELDVGHALGRGRYSEVHAVHRILLLEEHRANSFQLPANGRYVMKHIQNKLFTNRDHRRGARDLTNAVADLVTEAMYLSKLRHPHIIKLRGLTMGGTSVLKRPGAVAEDYFLLLDRMEETLDQRIHQRWRIKETTQSLALVLTKIRYACQMANALAYLHRHQILYRDLKPENIGFVLQDPQAEPNDFYRDRLQIYDFGLARELDEPPPPEGQPEKLYGLSASGTRRYMAPEIFHGKGRYNYKADVYSWALVFYECLSQVKPFADFTAQAHQELVCRLGGRPKLTDIVWPQAEWRQGLSQTLDALLQSAWNQDPFARPSMERVGQRLEEVLKEHGASPQSERPTATEVSGPKQLHLFVTNDPAADMFLREKTSTSELTVATDPMASDSEVDDDHLKAARWSHSSVRSSSISSHGMQRH